MADSPRQRFVEYARDPVGRQPVVSPFLPGTPPESFITRVQTTRDAAEDL